MPDENTTNILPVTLKEPTEPQVPAKEVDKGGRPTVMTPAILEELRKGFMFGSTDVQACAYAGISPATLYNYQTAHPEFLEIKDDWKQHPLLKAKVTVYNQLNDIDTAKWYLERKAKDEFGTRHELTGADGEDLIPKIVEDLDKNKTDYDKLGTEAGRQVVEINASLQNKGQTRPTGDIQPEPTSVDTSSTEGKPSVQQDSQG